ncbi:hypothetical protein F5Y07DRAFT_204659 [Xylaria sp. FL0933]|nr:hypothetical protein F5Y07DRAFT_204659 [Xylaria sp. FL0933]
MASSSTAAVTSMAPEVVAPAPPAHSIFEYLTTKNPNISHKNSEGPLTLNLQYLMPRRLKPWNEFNFDTMEQIFDRQLMTECMRRRLMHHIYPPLDPNRDLIEKSEDSTRWILKSWTIPMVNTALAAVSGSLSPVFWTAQGLAEPPESDIPSSRSDRGRTTTTNRPIRQARERSLSTRKGRKARSFIPDGGGLSLGSLSSLAAQTARRGHKKPLKCADRLPKEVKPGTKWTSEPLALGKIVDENGDWLDSMKWNRLSAPLRQIYTYCVQAKSRYGCIVTSKEVIAVRIKVDEGDGSLEDENPSIQERDLTSSLISHGLMEWKSIKWSEHRQQGENEEYRELTTSMALWVMHILAGNDNEIRQGYSPLIDEKLKVPSQEPSQPDPHSPGSTVSTIAYSIAESQRPQWDASFSSNAFQHSSTTVTDVGSSFTSTSRRKRQRDSPEAETEPSRLRPRRRY